MDLILQSAVDMEILNWIPRELIGAMMMRVINTGTFFLPRGYNTLGCIMLSHGLISIDE